MKPYPDLDAALLDAQRLAAGMTYKWAATDIDAGGGKAVLAVPPDLDSTARTGLLRRYGHLLASLRGLFRTGPDSGTTSEDMDLLAGIAEGMAFCRSISAGGSGNPAVFTAVGVFTAIRLVAERCFGSADLSGRTVAVQGAGSVGRELIGHLLAAGAEIWFCDVDREAVEAVVATGDVHVVEPDGIFDVPCDVFSPSALGGVLDARTIPRLRCRAVAGAANNQLATDDDGDRLRERGILYAPDFVANSGGAIAAPGIELRGWLRAEAMERVTSIVDTNLREIFAMADAESISTAAAACRLAERRLTAG
jgi:leucine dehydrogenase